MNFANLLFKRLEFNPGDPLNFFTKPCFFVIGFFLYSKAKKLKLMENELKIVQMSFFMIPHFFLILFQSYFN